MTHAGLDGYVAALARRVFPGSYSSAAVNVTVLYAVVLAARVVLSEWIAVPYQFTSYVAFVGGADRPLFSHRAAFPFAVAYLALSWLGLIASIPWWRGLGLLAP